MDVQYVKTLWDCLPEVRQWGGQTLVRPDCCNAGRGTEGAGISVRVLWYCTVLVAWVPALLPDRVRLKSVVL